ncbi:MAG: hypothetical protein ACT4QD_19060, partial [Acidobacteriota bacterium]
QTGQTAPARPGGSQEVYVNSVRYSRGQSIQPVFEGWTRNPDGSFDMWFGYLNRNYEERLNIPAGPDNGFNGEDMGQPEFFETRRQQFAFKVTVPATFPKDRDLVWTVKANGVTLRAFGSLWPVWEVDQNTISANRGARTAVDFDEPPNEAPRVVNPPAPQKAAVGTPLSLTLSIEDDGNPKPRADRGARVAGIKGAEAKPAEPPLNQSLRVSWIQWRGPGIASFEPRVVRVADGKATTTIEFDKPGRYVLRAYAEDARIHTPHDVEVIVAAAPSQR